MTTFALFIGPAGTGKTLAARRIAEAVSELPLPSDTATALAWMYYGVGMWTPDGMWTPCDEKRPVVAPLRAPHHTVSTVGLVGGGTVPRPGEVSLAHGGVLVLDELGEFRRATIEALACALRDGCATIVRGDAVVRYPARPAWVIAASNGCPCGRLGGTRVCPCAPASVERYHARVNDYAAMLAAACSGLPRHNDDEEV